MVARASPCKGIVLAWILVSSVSSILMFINVDASPAGFPSEKRAPIPITTSADCITSNSWFISCLSPLGLKQEPYDSGWLSGIVPLPPLEVTTGMFVASASLIRASSASDLATPPPANIRGMDERAMTPAASFRSSGLGTMREIRAGSRSFTSSYSTPASGGISIRTGRGRPVRICLNASNTASGTSRGLLACRCHLVTGRTASG